MWFCTYTLSKCFYNKDNKLQMQRIVGIYKCLEKLIYLYRKWFNWYRQLKKVYQYKNWKCSENTVIYFLFLFCWCVHMYFTARLSRTRGCGPFCFTPPARIIGSPCCLTRGWMYGCYPRIRTRSEDIESFCTCLSHITCF